MKKEKIMNSRIYNEYIELFTREKATAEKFGMPFDWDYKFSQLEFETRFQAYKNTNPDMSTKQIVRDIVDEQRFFHTEKQGRAIKDAAARRGIELTLKEARSWGGEDSMTAPKNVQRFWNEVRTAREQLKARGMTSADINKFIAVEFFGSPD